MFSPPPLRTKPRSHASERCHPHALQRRARSAGAEGPSSGDELTAAVTSLWQLLQTMPLEYYLKQQPRPELIRNRTRTTTTSGLRRSSCCLSHSLIRGFTAFELSLSLSFSLPFLSEVAGGGSSHLHRDWHPLIGMRGEKRDYKKKDKRRHKGRLQFSSGPKYI